MTLLVGIDLGTTNSAIAILDKTGKPEIVMNSEGKNVTPSVVYFESGSSNKAIIGLQAKAEEFNGQGRVFKEFKRRMPSQSNERIAIGGLSVTPIELSALVLNELKRGAESSVGLLTNVVITIPANYANEARVATMKAGEIAGIRVSHLVNEPTAAIFYYASQRPVAGTVMVYDFGGGTLDISIAKVNGKDVEIVTSKGDPRLGGGDFDRKLFEVIIKKFQAASGETFDKNIHSLAKSPEEYKEALSTREDVTVQVSGGPAGRTMIKVSRAEFEAATSTLVSKADLLVESTLEEAKLRPADITDVFLVGGSTRMPMLKQHLKRLFSKDPVCYVNPDEVVALGAALYAGYKADKRELNAAQASAVQMMKLKEVANHFFGTVSLQDDQATGKMIARVSILIEKNEPLPCSKTESYYTVAAGQTQVKCRVVQSATRETDPDFVRVIWEGELGPLPPNRPANMEVRVTYSYDTNQVMHCLFEDVTSGLKQEVKIGLKGEDQPSSESIEKFLVE